MLYGAVPSYRAAPDAPWGWADEQFEETMRAAHAAWGDGGWARAHNPSLAADERTSELGGALRAPVARAGFRYGEVMQVDEVDRPVAEQAVAERDVAVPRVPGLRPLHAHYRPAVSTALQVPRASGSPGAQG